MGYSSRGAPRNGGPGPNVDINETHSARSSPPCPPDGCARPADGPEPRVGSCRSRNSAARDRAQDRIARHRSCGREGRFRVRWEMQADMALEYEMLRETYRSAPDRPGKRAGDARCHSAQHLRAFCSAWRRDGDRPVIEVSRSRSRSWQMGATVSDLGTSGVACLRRPSRRRVNTCPILVHRGATMSTASGHEPKARDPRSPTARHHGHREIKRQRLRKKSRRWPLL